MQLRIEEVQFEKMAFRAPFRFGEAMLDSQQRCNVRVVLRSGTREAAGLGCMTLGNAWAWPSAPYAESLAAMQGYVTALGRQFDGAGLPNDVLEAGMVLEKAQHSAPREMPPLAAAVCLSAFDMALYDAWGRLHDANTFERLATDMGGARMIYGQPLASVLATPPSQRLLVYHSVGGVDALAPQDVTTPAADGLPECLEEWIAREKIRCFKIKLRGHDADWDYDRIRSVDTVCERCVHEALGVEPVYSLDFNEGCTDGAMAADLLERVRADQPMAFARIAFAEQPVPRDSDTKVGAAARLKPVCADESLAGEGCLQHAIDQGYTGLCVKACKGIGLSLRAAAFARAHHMYLCAQDLTCSGTAFLASASLAAHLGMEALEANARQFCPASSTAAATVYPEVFQVTDGRIGTTKLGGAGMGYDRLHSAK